MLSRRTSNLIFYGILVAILLVVVVSRIIIVGSMSKKIDETVISNRSLQTRITKLETDVQDNKDTASDHLFELYDKVPEMYNQEELVYYTVAQLELIGITDEFEVLRTVNVDEEIEISQFGAFFGTDDEFKVVEVSVYFNTLDLGVVDEFIDRMYSSEQIFVVSEIEYYNYTSGSYVGVNVSFLAFYKYVEETQ